MRLLLALPLILIMAGCGDRPVPPGKAIGGDWYQWEHMSMGGPGRFHDDELKVTCWQINSHVQCMTDAQIGRTK